MSSRHELAGQAGPALLRYCISDDRQPRAGHAKPYDQGHAEQLLARRVERAWVGFGMSADALELADWRRRVAELYAAVRARPDPEAAHALWRSGRDALFRAHPQSPLPPGDPLRDTGVPYWDYDPALRFELPLLPPPEAQQRQVPTDDDGVTTLRLIGRVALPGPVNAAVDVWSLRQYGGGLFLPLRDGTAGRTSYGGGRYLLDTAKGADLGGTDGLLTIDLNFLYHPSCRYSPQWQCPLAPPGNTTAGSVCAGERLSHDG